MQVICRPVSVRLSNGDRRPGTPPTVEEIAMRCKVLSGVVAMTLATGCFTWCLAQEGPAESGPARETPKPAPKDAAPEDGKSADGKSEADKSEAAKGNDSAKPASRPIEAMGKPIFSGCGTSLKPGSAK